MRRAWNWIELEIYFAVAGSILPIHGLTCFLVCTCTVHYTYTNNNTAIRLLLLLLLNHRPGLNPLSVTCFDLC